MDQDPAIMVQLSWGPYSAALRVDGTSYSPDVLNDVIVQANRAMTTMVESSAEYELPEGESHFSGDDPASVLAAMRAALEDDDDEDDDE